MIRPFLFLIISLQSLNGVSEEPYTFNYTNEHNQIYHDILKLRLSKADSCLSLLVQTDPYNLARLHLENYLDFISAFINEDRESYLELSGNKKRRIDLLDQLKESNPYKHFCIAEIELQNALVRSKQGKLFNAAREIYSAYSRLKRNEEKFPDFIFQNKTISLINALFESLKLPGILRSILGIDSSLEKAFSEIQTFLDSADSSESIFFVEAEAIKAYILSYQLMKKEEAWEFLNKSKLGTMPSALTNFLLAQLAQQSGKNEMAIQQLEKKPPYSDQAQFHYLDFMLAVSKMRKLDPTSILCMNSFINNFKGNHYIKEAYQKLAWGSLIFENDTSEYIRYMSVLRSKGDDLLDGDIQAQNEARLGHIPNIQLLKARLLFDGAYYQRALELLNSETGPLSAEDRIELIYRKARIYHNLDNDILAIRFYKKLIDSANGSDYRLCNAYLQMGNIYEKNKQYDEAEGYYLKSLSLSPSSYKRSLHQKARTGLLRIKKW